MAAAGQRALQQAVSDRAAASAAPLGGQTRTPPPELSPAGEQTVEPSFFGSLWSGVKHAASAVGSGIKTAATAVAGAARAPPRGSRAQCQPLPTGCGMAPRGWVAGRSTG